MDEEELKAARRQLEQILGVPPGSIGVPPPIPGTEARQGREIRYVGCEPGEPNIAKWMDRLATEFGELPNEGGFMEEGFRATLPLGEQLFAVSYRGDIEGWRRAICLAAGRLKYLVARIENGVVIVDDGRKVPLDLCKFERLEINRRGRILAASENWQG